MIMSEDETKQILDELLRLAKPNARKKLSVPLFIRAYLKRFKQTYAWEVYSNYELLSIAYSEQHGNKKKSNYSSVLRVVRELRRAGLLSNASTKPAENYPEVLNPRKRQYFVIVPGREDDALWHNLFGTVFKPVTTKTAPPEGTDDKKLTDDKSNTVMLVK